MLEVDGIEYRVEDMRKIGKAAQEEHGEGLTGATPVGPAGLTWAQLVDPRIALLLEARPRYRFTTWGQVTQVLDASWQYDEDNERTHGIPASLAGHVVLPRTAPFVIPPHVTLEMLFSGVRTGTGTHSELIRIAKPDVSWKTAANAGNRIDRHNALQKLWGVCGAASQSLIERLCALDANVVQTFFRVFEGAEDARLLEAVLQLPVKETVFIHIAEPSVHEFTIEKRPDGTAYLHQGYLSAYSAMWWAGVAGADQAPFFTLSGKQAASMRDMRDIYGAGQPIPLNTFAWCMYDYLFSDVHGAKSGKAWAKLPFNPGLAEEAERWTGKSIVLQVKGFQLADEAAARKGLGDRKRDLPIVTLVMEEAARMLAK